MIPSLHLPIEGGAIPITFPFGAQPVDDQMRAQFQMWGIDGHHGIDFGVPMASRVLAVDKGTVSQAGENGDFGITVIIEHAWGQSLYAHLLEAKVDVGQTVKPGDLIAASGKTGKARGPHLHFGIKPEDPDVTNGYRGFVDPAPYLFTEPGDPRSLIKTSSSDRWASISTKRTEKQKTREKKPTDP